MAEGIHVVLVVNDEAAHWQGYRDRLAANDGAASVSVAVPAGERRDSILAALGDKVRTVAEDPAELFAAESPQLAVITVPPLDSPPIIDAALDAGAHVLAEKPASVSDTALELLARKAVQRDRHLMLAFAGSQQPAVRDAARIIRDEGRLGALYGVTAHYIADQARIRDVEQLQRRTGSSNTWFFEKRVGGGGHLSWLGIHFVDMLHVVTGHDIVEVSAMTNVAGGQPIDVEDSAVLTLRYDNGMLASLTSAYYLGPARRRRRQAGALQGLGRERLAPDRPARGHPAHLLQQPARLRRAAPRTHRLRLRLHHRLRHPHVRSPPRRGRPRRPAHLNARCASGASSRPRRLPLRRQRPRPARTRPRPMDAPMTAIPTLETDVLVCGAGIAGLTAARTAQEAGARVVVLEKGPETGGSSAVSAGIVWTARDLAGWLSVQPGGDPTLGKAQVTTYPEAIEWLRSQHVRLEPFEFGASGWNPPFPYAAFQLEPKEDGRSNPRAAMDRLTANIAEAGGRILTETAIREFHQDAAGRIIGAEARGPNGRLRISAKATVMATGGFQGNPELRARYFGPHSDRMILRANPYSTGEAFQAATAAGAGTVGPFGRFYGHRVVAPPAVVDFPSFPRVHLGGALPGAILVNLRGERYVDESESDEVSVHALPHQPDALGFMIYSESDAATDVGSAALDTVRSVGTEILEAPSLDSLAEQMAARWGVARAPLLRHP